MDNARASFQLGTLFPQGHYVMDVAVNEKVRVAVALPAGQAVLDQGCKGGGSYA